MSKVLMSNSYAITTQDLTKYYGSVRGVDGVNIQVRQGKVFELDARRQSVQIRRRLGNPPGDVALHDTLKGREVMLRGAFALSNVPVYLGITTACVAASLVVFQRRKVVV